MIAEEVLSLCLYLFDDLIVGSGEIIDESNGGSGNHDVP